MFAVCHLTLVIMYTSLVYGDEANLLCYQDYPEEKLQELKSLMMAEVSSIYSRNLNFGIYSYLYSRSCLSLKINRMLVCLTGWERA